MAVLTKRDGDDEEGGQAVQCGEMAKGCHGKQRSGHGIWTPGYKQVTRVPTMKACLEDLTEQLATPNGWKSITPWPTSWSLKKDPSKLGFPSEPAYYLMGFPSICIHLFLSWPGQPVGGALLRAKRE